VNNPTAYAICFLSGSFFAHGALHAIVGGSRQMKVAFVCFVLTLAGLGLVTGANL
jgi:hypothetical protein